MKHEILRETDGVSFDGLHEHAWGNLIKAGKVCAEHDLLPAQKINALLYSLPWDDSMGVLHRLSYGIAFLNACRFKVAVAANVWRLKVRTVANYQMMRRLAHRLSWR
ncbi:MAG: hypothetical protein ACE5H0_10855 [Bacteroidota bacterium]